MFAQAPKTITKPAERPIKVSNGHLTAKDQKRTIVFTWGKYSITLLCFTAVAISLIHKLKF